MKLIIDSHLDLSWNALAWKRDLEQSLARINEQEQALSLTDDPARGKATVTLPEMRKGGIAVCLGTLLARAVQGEVTRRLYENTLDFPNQSIAHATACGQLAYYRMLHQRGQVALIFNAPELDAHWQTWGQAASTGNVDHLPIGLIVAMEGSDAIVDVAQADWWHEQGLRCASLVHYGRSAYAVGTGDDGPLTPRGRDMLKAFERLGIILDVTHLSDSSFAEAMDHYAGPVLASHSNCRALVHDPRQFTDEQLHRIIERGGVIGVACDAWMLVNGWVRGRTQRDVVTIDALADHIDHICQLAGNVHHVAIGTDLDGGFGWEQTPVGLETIADLQKLVAILTRRGYADGDIDAVFHGNWLGFFRKYLTSSR